MKTDVLQNTELSFKSANLNFIEKAMLFVKPKARIIDVSFNNIRSLDLGIFSTSLYLEFLNLFNTRIQRLINTSMVNNLSITTIILQKNSLAYIDYNVFSFVPNLEKLDLSFNIIVKIDKLAFTSLKKLKILDLSYNNIVELDSDIFKENLELTSCSLEYNKMFKLPKSLLLAKNCVIKIELTPVHKVTGSDQEKIKDYIRCQIC